MIITHHGADSLKRGETITIGGRKYPIVKIGDRIWMAENLDYRYDGLQVGGTPSYNVRTPHAYYYNNDEPTYGYNGRKYGLLYNNYCVTELASLLPEGWSIPNQDDFDALREYCSNDSTVLKSKDFWVPSVGTNAYKFNAPPSSATNTNSLGFFDQAFFLIRGSHGGCMQLVAANSTVNTNAVSSAWISTSIRLVKRQFMTRGLNHIQISDYEGGLSSNK
jgi:uncharacterized protein (TIGR02145 family)